MATYVLVHGAWHGGWCWHKVARLLRAEGHDVFTPTMTGLGERQHLAGPAIGLDTHITDIANVLAFEDLEDVILVGHSYGGMVVPCVADLAPERIKHLVFLDAFVPEDGDSLTSLRVASGAPPPIARDPVDWQMILRAGNDFGVTQPDEVTWLRSKLVPHLYKTTIDELHLKTPTEDQPFALTYIFAAGDDMTPAVHGLREVSQRLRTKPRWQVHDLPTGHDVMVTMPNELTDILLAMA